MLLGAVEFECIYSFNVYEEERNLSGPAGTGCGAETRRNVMSESTPGTNR